MLHILNHKKVFNYLYQKDGRKKIVVVNTGLSEHLQIYLNILSKKYIGADFFWSNGTGLPKGFNVSLDLTPNVVLYLQNNRLVERVNFTSLSQSSLDSYLTTRVLNNSGDGTPFYG